MLQDPSLRREVEQGLFNDPGLWLAAEEQMLSDRDQAELKQQKKAEMKKRVMERVQEKSELPLERLKRTIRVPRSVSVAAACLIALLLFFVAVPAGTTTAANFFAKIVRKVTGYVVIESDGEAPPNIVKPNESKISGVDGFTFIQCQTISALMEKSELDPVVLTTGYTAIANIAYEAQEGEYQEIIIAYELADGGFMNTSQHWEKGIHAEKPFFSEKREILDGITAYTEIDDDGYEATAEIESSRFSIIAPKGVDFDAVLNGLSYGSALDAAAFAVKPPEGSSVKNEPEYYSSLEEFSRKNGIWPLALKDEFAVIKDVKLYTGRPTGDTLYTHYDSKDGWIGIFQMYGYMDGMTATMNDETYFETTILDGIPIYCSVDAVDGTTSGIAALDDSALMITTEKGVDFNAVLKNLIVTSPQKNGMKHQKSGYVQPALVDSNTLFCSQRERQYDFVKKLGGVRCVYAVRLFAD